MSALGCNRLLALSFYPMAGDAARRITIVPPLLRKEVLHNKECSQENFILGYIVNNAFADQIKAWSKEHPDYELHVFWDNRDYPEMWKAERNLTFHGSRKSLAWLHRHVSHCKCSRTIQSDL